MEQPEGPEDLNDVMAWAGEFLSTAGGVVADGDISAQDMAVALTAACLVFNHTACEAADASKEAIHPQALWVSGLVTQVLQQAANTDMKGLATVKLDVEWERNGATAQ